MKKRFIIAFAAVLCLSMLLTGCGGDAGKVYDYDLSEYVKLGQYKGIEIQAIEITVTKKEIQDEIKKRLDAAGSMEELTEGVVQDGDAAKIDYEGKLKGVAFDGGTAKDQELIIGSDRFIPGFEKGLIGKEIGDTVVLELTFPEEYPSNTALEGQKTEFTVKIHSVKRTIPATYDVKFVEENSEFKTIAEYETSVQQELEEKKKAAADSEKEGIVWKKIMEDSEILKYPDKEVQDSMDRTMGIYGGYAQSANMSWEEFLGTQIGMTPEEFEAELKEYAQQQIGQEMTLYAIANAEGIEISNKEYKEGIKNFIEEQGFESEKAFKKENNGKSFEQVIGKKNIEVALLAEKVFDFILEEAVEKVVKE